LNDDVNVDGSKPRPNAFSPSAKEFLLSMYTLVWTANSVPCPIRDTEGIKTVV